MSSIDVDDIMPGRWNHLRKILERPGPFCHSDFEPSPDNLQVISNRCNVLLIGAGGLGCELLKDLALMGFHKISVIDMDTIDLSNLNRQFLFRRKDIGKPKAEVAAKYINDRIPGVKVTPYFSSIQDFDEMFYQQFDIIVCGLDSIVARRWINGMIFSMLVYNDGELDTSTVIPIIDGGTEGFKGNVRVIYPGLNACIECTLDLYPPQVNYPLCTIANTPRLPEHCIEYVKVVQWNKENPFDCPLDGDDPNHINWVYEKSQDRANQFGITGLSYRLVQGVVKNIIPAVASTNAVIAAACALEVFKVATSCFTPLNNYLVFNDTDGIYTYSYESEKKPDCIVCSNIPQNIEIECDQTTLQTLMDRLCSLQFQMKNPGITANIAGSSKTLYLPNVKSIEEITRGNLKKTLAELGIKHDTLIYVADITNPKTLSLYVKFKSYTEMSVE